MAAARSSSTVATVTPSGIVQQARPIPGDGAFLRGGSEPPLSSPPHLKPITRVSIDYLIEDQFGKAEVVYCYPIGTRVIMADGNILQVEYLKPGMRFRLEDGGVATVTKVEPPKVWQPPSGERDEHGNSFRRVIGRVKYTGYFPRLDLGVPGDVIKTTPGHPFYSETRRMWMPAETFQPGEFLRNRQGLPVPVQWRSAIRFEFCELYNAEVEDLHTYYVGNGPHGGIWAHNGMGINCRVPKAATEEALETGAINRTSRRLAGVLTEAEQFPQHHIFPKDRVARQWFGQRGIDVDQYTVRIPRDLHEALHSGGGLGKGGGWYSDEVMGFLRQQERTIGRELTAAEIQQHGLDFMERFGFRDFPIQPYIRPGG